MPYKALWCTRKVVADQWPNAKNKIKIVINSGDVGSYVHYY